MKVAELIEFLKTQPQDLDVAYAIYSEYCLLGCDEIVVKQLCVPRKDGWVARPRNDKELKEYLVFPGN